MRKAAEICYSVLRGVLFIGFTVQGILGIAWMAGNFLRPQAFAKDSGLLYPLLLKAAEGMGKVFHIPYFCILYVLQTAAAICAVWFFLGTFQIFEHTLWLRIWGLIAVLTNFMTAQCLFALLPNAFLASCMLVFCALTFKIAKEREKNRKKAGLLVLIWVIMAGFAAEYLLFAAVLLPAALLFIYGRKMLWTAGVGAAALVVSAVLLSGGFWEAAFSRFTWNTILYDEDEAPDFVRDVLSGQEIYRSQMYADMLHLETIPLIKSRLGDEEAEIFLKKAVKEAWKNWRSVILHDLAWDFTGYTVSPVIAGLNLKGVGFRSLSTRNYEIMGRETPILTRYYVNYEICWFRALVIAGGLCLAFRFAAGSVKRSRIRAIFFCALTGIAEAIWYTMQGAGIMDYKETIVTVMFWGSLFCFWIDKRNEGQEAL